MEKMITVETGYGSQRKAIEEIVLKYPLWLRNQVREAFLAEEEGDYERAEGLCVQILDQDAGEPEIRMLLGRSYFSQGKIRPAMFVFSDLVQEFPEEELPRLYLGMCQHGLGDYRQAVRELEKLWPLKEYHPFYYTAYGDSLQQVGKKKQSREAFRAEIAVFEETGKIPSPVMLDGAYENLLYLDVELGNGEYQNDLESYYRFLERIEMTEEMQGYLAGNIVYLCGQMSNKWYRPLFLELISHIKEKNYLTTDDSVRVLDSAFSSWESYQYHEDNKVNSLLETWLGCVHERKYSDESMLDQDERDRIIVKSLAYDWYLCQYYPEHEEELEYIKNRYPHTYTSCSGFLDKVRTDRQGMAGELLEKLSPFAKNTSRAELESSMHIAYKAAVRDRKEPVYVYDGTESYTRMQPKIGRNDPCPCGSGKKYKKCCGK